MNEDFSATLEKSRVKRLADAVSLGNHFHWLKKTMPARDRKNNFNKPTINNNISSSPIGKAPVGILYARLCWRAYFIPFSKLLSPNVLCQWEQVRGCFLRQIVFQKNFCLFLKNRGCVLTSQFQISERAFYQIKNFSETPDNFVLLPVGTSEGINFLKNFFLEGFSNSQIFSHLDLPFALPRWE